MRPIERWARMMSSTVLIAPLASVDTYGKPQFGTDVAYRAHLQQGNRLMVDYNGQQVTASVTAHLMARVAISPTARVTLSTGDIGSTASWMRNPRIVMVEERFDQGGLHHTAVHMQFAPRTALPT